MAAILTPLQEAFCVQLVASKNATEAYRAVYNCSNSRPSSVNRLAKELIDNPKIASRVRELQGIAADKLLVSEESVLREQARIGFSDLRRVFNGKRLKDIADLDDDTARAVQSVKVVTRMGSDGEIEYVHEIKLWPKNNALDSLSRHLGLFERDNAQSRPLVSIRDFSGGAGGPVDEVDE